MMLMCGQSNPIWHYWAGTRPGKVGVLVGPSYHTKLKMRPWMPYALDNDAFMAFTSKKPWNEALWLKMLQWARMTGQAPLWVLVPDVVADRQATLDNWKRYAPVAREFGWPLAFAVQDGMTPDDVPSEASVVFVGGSDEFKYRALPVFCANFPHVHAGRVNEVYKLQVCERLKVKSADGSGWFRDTRRMPELEHWMTGNHAEHPDLFEDAARISLQ